MFDFQLSESLGDDILLIVLLLRSMMAPSSSFYWWKLEGRWWDLELLATNMSLKSLGMSTFPENEDIELIACFQLKTMNLLAFINQGSIIEYGWCDIENE